MKRLLVSLVVAFLAVVSFGQDSDSLRLKQVMVDSKTTEGYKYDFRPQPGTDSRPVPVQHFGAVEQQVFGH